ncbi:hypothetical protein OHA37_14285 [Streptomyces sp. NBC_00335]|uniref:hypothetical protein n=1 Tax=unclassified Streptomyces TaxID=2593676 RepID=UPI002255A0AB|nr:MULTISPECIES: hypothetical protein [unclassified Streptomyces]MCX5405050.1 hypothetical protein [Streptomyces sp. NBC_00086]
MSLPHVYRVTKYDPADRAPNGTYQGTQDSDSDRGPVEAAYLAAVGAFAEESGAGLLTVRDPQTWSRRAPPRTPPAGTPSVTGAGSTPSGPGSRRAPC